MFDIKIQRKEIYKKKKRKKIKRNKIVSRNNKKVKRRKYVRNLLDRCLRFMRLLCISLRCNYKAERA